jgi:SPP1 gp7 family putative phage head morphogenesis protein
MPQLRAPTRKPITLAPVHPNAGLTVAYQKKIDALVDAMQRSLVYWLTAAYKANPPEMATDASPAATLRASMNKLSRYWQKRFDDAAPDLAKWFSENAMQRSDGALRDTLKRAGFTVKFSLSREANDVLQATIGENVALIKSIGAEHLSQVEGLVMRSVQQGRDVGTLTEELHQRYGVTKRRAAFIALDQNNKATATVTRVRQQALGITEAVWLHSHGGKEPRKSHQEADGKKFDVKKGMLIDGEYIWPGQLPRCRCVSRSVIPGLEDD